MLKDFIKKIIYKEKAKSDSYINYLRNKGMKIGKDCIIYAPTKTIIDEQYPWLITIGNHVRITEGVVLLTHDYSWSVLKQISVNGQKGAVLGAAGKIEIGNNVFIGINSIVLRGVKIEDNVIIGAGSVVTKDCESGCVYAGNPAKKISTVEEFYKKRMELQISEAKTLATSYYERFNEMPPEEVFHEFFMLFEDNIPNNKTFSDKMHLCENFTDSCNYIKNNKPKFCSYEEFLKFCFEGGEE